MKSHTIWSNFDVFALSWPRVKKIKLNIIYRESGVMGEVIHQLLVRESVQKLIWKYGGGGVLVICTIFTITFSAEMISDNVFEMFLFFMTLFHCYRENF